MYYRYFKPTNKKPNRNRKTTDEQIKTMIELYRAGLGIVSIGKATDVHRDNVLYYLCRAGVYKKKRSRRIQYTSKILKLADNYNANEIATITGYGVLYIKSVLKKARPIQSIKITSLAQFDKVFPGY